MPKITYCLVCAFHIAKKLHRQGQQGLQKEKYKKNKTSDNKN